jgi:hypothetical protein
MDEELIEIAIGWLKRRDYVGRANLGLSCGSRGQIFMQRDGLAVSLARRLMVPAGAGPSDRMRPANMSEACSNRAISRELVSRFI